VANPYQITKSSFTDSVLCASLSGFDPDSHLLHCHPICFFAICDRQPLVVSIALLLVATAQHCKRGSRKLLTFRLILLFFQICLIFFRKPLPGTVVLVRTFNIFSEPPVPLNTYVV